MRESKIWLPCCIIHQFFLDIFFIKFLSCKFRLIINFFKQKGDKLVVSKAFSIFLIVWKLFLHFFFWKGQKIFSNLWLSQINHKTIINFLILYFSLQNVSRYSILLWRILLSIFYCISSSFFKWSFNFHSSGRKQFSSKSFLILKKREGISLLIINIDQFMYKRR